MNLIVGATGMVGGEICRLLAAKGKPVRALVRKTSDQAKVNALKALGAEIVVGDVRDRASLDAACKGATAVISTVSALPFSYVPGENDIETVDREGLKSLIAAAKAAGVKHFIYTSFSGQLDLDFPLRNAKRAVEKVLRGSGLTYTILHPTFFMEVWLSEALGFDAANHKARIYGTGENPISWISFQDVAKFAVESLDNPAARNATLEMGGTEAISPNDVVRLFERVSRKRFDVEHVPAEALEAQQKEATDPAQQSFPALMRGYAQGDPIDVTALRKAFPFELRTVEAFARGVYGLG